MQQILAANQSEAEFRHPGGIVFILIGSHAGGTWKVQVRDPDDTEWIDDDPALEASGSQIVIWHGSPELRYRIVGGSVGAKAWLVRNSQHPGAGI